MNDKTIAIKLKLDNREFNAELQLEGRQIKALAGAIQQEFGRAGHSVDGLTASMGRLGSVITAASVTLLAKQYAETAMEADRLRALLEGATGSVEAGARAMEFARGIASRYGLDLVVTAQAFGKLAASAKGTALEGRETERIFSAVAKAAATLSLTAADTEGALLAISQMISKGTVSAEELRGQLGERLPGAFQIAARAMGLTTAELDKLLAKGDLATTDFLPRFATAIDQAFGSSRFDNAAQNVARLNNTWTELKQNLTNSTWVSEIAKGLTERLQLLAELADRLGMNRAPGGAKYGPEVWSYMEDLRQRLDNSMAGRGTMQDPSGIAPKPVPAPSAANAAKATGKASRGDQYDDLFAAATAKYGLPAGLVKAVADRESRFNPRAVGADADPKDRGHGLMQITPATGRMLGLQNPYDPAQNIDAGAKYLAQLMRRFAGDPRQTEKALASYNAGAGNVEKYGLDRVLSPTWGRGIYHGGPGKYVAEVLGNMERYGDTVGLSDRYAAEQSAADRRKQLEAETQQYLSQQRQAELDRYSRAQELETARIEAAYQNRELSAGEYFGRLDALQQAAAARQVAALRQEADEERGRQGHREAGTEEYVQGQEKILALESRIAQVQDGAALAGLRNRQALTAATREQTQALQDQLAAVRLRLMEPGAGGTVTESLLPPAAREEFQARLQVLEGQYRDFLTRLRQAGDAGGEALVRRAMVGEATAGMRQSLEGRIQSVQGAADSRAQGIRAQQEAGNLTQIQAREQIAQVYRESAEAIRGNVEQLERLAAASNDPAMVQAAERARAAWLDMTHAVRGPMQTLMASWSDVGMQLEQQSTQWISGLTDQLAALVTTGKASFGDFARAILADLVKIGIQAMISRAAMAALGGGGGAGGVSGADNALFGLSIATKVLGLFGGIAGAAGAGANAAASAGATNGIGAVNVSGANLGSYASLTAAVHHAGGIVGAAGTSRTLPALTFAQAPRYHGGGLAGLKPGEVPAILMGGPKGRREEVLTAADPRHRDNGGMRPTAVGDTTIVNVLDPALVGQYLATKPGERLVMNIIQRNAGSVRRMTDRG